MKFFKEGNATADNYKMAITIMEKETSKSICALEKMIKVMIGGLLLLIISISLIFLWSAHWGYAGVLISLVIIYLSFKKWQRSRMEMCFSLYSYDLLKKEYLELFVIKN